MKKNKDYELDVPKFNFGTKTVIRPLPTCSISTLPAIKTLGELKQYLIKRKKSES